MSMEKRIKTEGHVSQTVGGVGGHVFRRVVHIAIGIIPILYYAYGESVAGLLHLSAKQLVIAVFIANILLEGIRLCFGWTLLGYRRHEARRISSFSWGVFSICLILFLAPGQRYAVPIIWSCALVDPLLGELRTLKWNTDWVFIIGVVATMVIWLLCTWWFGTPALLAVLMGPLIVALERPNFKWVDDNAMMQVIPLLIVLLLYG